MRLHEPAIRVEDQGQFVTGLKDRTCAVIKSAP